ncbi:MAG: type VI secretion system tip protein TssI/VgrG [Planctomycetota bacterium]|nr:type VI secretion system tip protein TssI/VgrG [Planctomycetota bacterium]
MADTQKTRWMAIGTTKGEDHLLLKSIHGSEELGRLFEYEADLIATSAAVKPDEILGQNVTVRFGGGDAARYLNGYIARLQMLGEPNASGGDPAATMIHYRITIVPFLWFLTRQSDCRIFNKQQTAKDIVLQVVKDQHGFSDVEDKVTGDLPKREYCVQYRETDFDFISRLMEEEGIYYYFKHENGKHIMVLCNSPAAHAPCVNATELPFRPGMGPQGRDRVAEWSVEHELRAAKYAQEDFDFRASQTKLSGRASVAREHVYNTFELFDYPARHAAPGLGFGDTEAERLAKIRLEEVQATQQFERGRTDSLPLCVGTTFKLTEHPYVDSATEHLVVSTTLHAVNNLWASSDEDPASYGCSFTAVPSGTTYRPARLTPRPVVRGLQTGIVVGSSGGEILTDEHARVRVKFHWDRESASDENCSCWMRVSQAWAGKGWGFMAIPRIGQEVIVEFLEGDPDRPVVTGRLYNDVNKPAYALPANATMTYIKTNSSKGGGGFNELRFEDKKDSENVFLHAQKDLDVRVLNIRKEWIGKDRHLVVGNDLFEHVKRDRHEQVDRDHKELIKRDRSLKVEGKEAKHVVKTLSLTVDDDVAEVFKKNHAEETTKQYFLKAEDVIIEGLKNITIKVGKSFIAIEESGIKISTDGEIVQLAKKTIKVTSEGPQGGIAVEASVGDVGVKGTKGVKLETPATLEAKGLQVNVAGDSMTEVKGAMSTVKGDATLTLKGGMVMIN